MARVCVLGSFMMDLVATAPRRPFAGETLVGTGFAARLGGKGFNQAVAAARAGAETAMVGALGDDDFAEQFRAALRTEGVDGEQIGVRPLTGTGVGLPVVEPGGQNSIIIVPRANEQLTERDVRQAAEQIQKADVLLLQLEVPIETAVIAARIAHEADTTVVLNPAPAATIPPELAELVDILVPNEVELETLAGLGSGIDAEVAGRHLRERWDLDVVVTRGSRGVLVLDGIRAATMIAAHTVRAVDTVGAGDTFCGYLGAELAAGARLVDAARIANAAAALSVTQIGSADAVPARADVQRLIARADRAPGHAVGVEQTRRSGSTEDVAAASRVSDGAVS